MPAAAVKVSYALRIPPDNMNHNAEFSLEQQTTYYSYRFPILNNIYLLKVALVWPMDEKEKCRSGEEMYKE